jgi:DNA-directed RNA polymerase beta' subunit
MPYDAYQRAIEFHNKAAHAHAAAAASHDKGDHLTAHELSKQAREHSLEAMKHSEAALAHFNATQKPGHP